MLSSDKRHVITRCYEHKSIYKCCKLQVTHFVFCCFPSVCGRFIHDQDFLSNVVFCDISSLVYKIPEEDKEAGLIFQFSCFFLICVSLF